MNSEALLSWACSHADMEVADRLLRDKSTIQINQADHDGHTPLFTACQRGHLDLVDRLLQEKDAIHINQAGKDGSPLFIACKTGRLDLVDRLLQEKDAVQINQANESTCWNEKGSSPLFVACQCGHTDVVDRLLRVKDIQINQAASNGFTPLYVACVRGHTDVVDRLLQEKDIQINQASKDSVTPLNAASDQGHTEVVRLLLQHVPVIDLDLKDKWGDTALMAAQAMNGKTRKHRGDHGPYRGDVDWKKKRGYHGDLSPKLDDAIVNTDAIVQLLTDVRLHQVTRPESRDDINLISQLINYYL
jgi:serine/threonine-protein phosphatase 6 regulatory ankyrin repeat subunit B